MLCVVKLYDSCWTICYQIEIIESWCFQFFVSIVVFNFVKWSLKSSYLLMDNDVYFAIFAFTSCQLRMLNRLSIFQSILLLSQCNNEVFLYSAKFSISCIVQSIANVWFIKKNNFEITLLRLVLPNVLLCFCLHVCCCPCSSEFRFR
jgi:hypothetical protein